MKKNVKEHVVEVKFLLLLLHHSQVYLPLLLPLDQVGVLQPLSSHLLSLGLYASFHTQMYVLCLLNHIHDVGCKSTALEGPLTHTPDL